MALDQNISHALYKKLLRLYPRDFYELLGESMEQTFNDLCNERRRKREQGFFGFVLWMFIETASGIIKEHFLRLTQGAAMKNLLAYPRSAAILSLILVLPFMVLESVNRRNFHEGFPIPLFGILWLLPMVFTATLMPIIRHVRAGNSILANPVNLLLRASLLATITWLWAAILIDQLPCFLGVSNCD